MSDNKVKRDFLCELCEERYREIFEMNDGEYVDFFIDEYNIEDYFPGYDSSQGSVYDHICSFEPLEDIFGKVILKNTDNGVREEYDISYIDVIPNQPFDDDEEEESFGTEVMLTIHW